MPCDQVIINTVDVPKMNKALRKAAMRAAKFQNVREHSNGRVITFDYEGESYSLSDGVLRGLDGQSETEVGRVADLLKRQYSNQVVQLTARRNGWTLKPQGVNAAGEIRYQVIKR